MAANLLRSLRPFRVRSSTSNPTSGYSFLHQFRSGATRQVCSLMSLMLTLLHCLALLCTGTSAADSRPRHSPSIAESLGPPRTTRTRLACPISHVYYVHTHSRPVASELVARRPRPYRTSQGPALSVQTLRYVINVTAWLGALAAAAVDAASPIDS